ncbi:MAG TPA: potassium transporter TrkG, partial [Planctomycetaceae bacterium]|nr:potassium transporter TrkG [Planctomycetaceae bacterium]
LLSRTLGLLGMLVGGSMVFSLPWAFPFMGETAEFEARGFWGLIASIACSLVVGGSLFFAGRKSEFTILRKEALAIVGLGWLLAGVLGSLPFVFSGVLRAEGVPMSIIDALFESISGFTTTGASVLTELDDPAYVPRCVLFWRSFTHWLGGMGIIVLFVALLGHLGAGGKALMRREVPGPINESVRPRIRETAIAMWLIYLALSGLLALILYFEGMSPFDALCHCYGTMATGGFSTHNASVGHFQSPLIETTITVFMILAGTNFTLYYLGLHSVTDKKARHFRPTLRPFRHDPEFRIYLLILLVATLLLTGSLWMNQLYEGGLACFRHAAFNVVAIMTTTGFGTEDYTDWSEFSKGMLFLLMFVGGSAGSTAGGLKVIRMILFVKVLHLEIEHAFRPNVIRPLRIANSNVDHSLRHEVTVYFSLILVIGVLSSIGLTAIELNTQWVDAPGEKLIDCASAVAATLNNIGPGLGVVGPHSNYTDFSSPGKLLLSLLMLLGRLELFAVLVLFVPSFWRSQ